MSDRNTQEQEDRSYRSIGASKTPFPIVTNTRRSSVIRLWKNPTKRVFSATDAPQSSVLVLRASSEVARIPV